MWIIPCEEWKDGWHREHNMRICSQFTIQVSVLYEYICVTTGTQDSQMWFTVDSGESPVHPGVVCVQIYFSMPLITIYLITTPTCDSLELGCNVLVWLFWNVSRNGFCEYFSFEEAFGWGSSDYEALCQNLCALLYIKFDLHFVENTSICHNCNSLCLIPSILFDNRKCYADDDVDFGNLGEYLWLFWCLF